MLKFQQIEEMIASKPWSQSTKISVFHKLKLLEALKFDPEATFNAMLREGYSSYSIKQYMIIGTNINPAYKEFLNRNKQRFKGCYKTKTDLISHERVNELVSNPETHNLVYLMARCGLRISEALNARWSDFIGDKNLLDVVGKGAKQRQVPCLRKELSPNNSETIAGNITPSMLVSLRKAMKPFTPHSLRAYYINFLFEKGIQINQIKDAVGHSSITSTDRYCRSNMADLAKRLFGEE